MRRGLRPTRLVLDDVPETDAAPETATRSPHTANSSSTHDDVRHSDSWTTANRRASCQLGAHAACLDAAAAAAAATEADPLAWERAFDSGPSAARIAAAQQICSFAESAPLPLSVLLRAVFINTTEDATEEGADESATDYGLAMMVQGLAALLAVSTWESLR